MTRFMVIADGAGEYDSDFSITWFEAESAEQAATIAIAPENGYGKRDNGTIYVVAERHVRAFETTERTTVELMPKSQTESA